MPGQTFGRTSKRALGSHSSIEAVALRGWLRARADGSRIAVHAQIRWAPSRGRPCVAVDARGIVTNPLCFAALRAMSNVAAILTTCTCVACALLKKGEGPYS